MYKHSACSYETTRNKVHISAKFFFPKNDKKKSCRTTCQLDIGCILWHKFNVIQRNSQFKKKKFILLTSKVKCNSPPSSHGSYHKDVWMYTSCNSFVSYKRLYALSPLGLHDKNTMDWERVGSLTLRASWRCLARWSPHVQTEDLANICVTLCSKHQVGHVHINLRLTREISEQHLANVVGWRRREAAVRRAVSA